MKRKLWIILALAALLSLLCCGAALAELTTGECGENVQYSFNSVTGELTLTGTGPTYEYEWYDETKRSPFDGNESITSVTISSGITRIGCFLFDDCHNLTSVTIPDSVESIGNCVFYDCGMETITLPSGLTNIPIQAFTKCSQLTSVTIPAGVTEIGMYAFYECESLTSVTFQGSAPSIGDKAFFDDNIAAYYTPDATWTAEVMEDYGGSIVWVPAGTETPCGAGVYGSKSGATLTIYGAGAMADYQQSGSVSPFSGDAEIETIVVTSGVTKIGAWAFRGCANLTRIDIPASVTEIGVSAFSGCPGLTVHGRQGSPAQSYAAANGIPFAVLVDASGECGSGVTWELAEGTLTIRGTGEMEDYVSYWPPYDSYRGQIRHVVIEPGVSYIGVEAFRDMLIEDVSIPSTVKTVGRGAFMSCNALTELSFPEGVTSLGEKVCYWCDKLTSVTIPASVTEIGEDAFRQCGKLSNVHFQGAAPAIGANAFGVDTLLAFYPPDQPGWTAEVRQGYGGSVTWLTSAENLCGDGLAWALSGGTLTISGKGAMWDFDSDQPGWYDRRSEITAVVFEDGVTYVGNLAFAGCASLTSVSFEGDAPFFGENAFQGITATAFYHSEKTGWAADVTQNYGGAITWTSVNPGGACGANGTWEFVGGDTLIISGTGPMADYSGSDSRPYYSYKNQITHVVVEPGVTHIGDYAFYYFSKMEDVSLPAGLETIGRYAFSNCDTQFAITLPEGLTGIGEKAFYYSWGLKQIMIPASVTTIGSSAFSRCTYLTSIDFLGEAPAIGEDVLANVTARANYPAGDASWTAEVRAAFGGTITWIAGTESLCGDGLTWELTDGVLTFGGSGAMWDFDSDQPNWYARRAEITSVVINSKVTRVGKNAFAGCANLSSVTFEGNAPAIGENAFQGVTATAAYFSEKTGWTADVMQNYGGTITWTSVNPGGACGANVTWELDGDTLIISGTGPMADYDYRDSSRPYYSYVSQIKHLVIQPGVTHIGDHAFYWLYKIKDVSIPSTVETVGSNAFKYCDALTAIAFPEGVTSLGERVCYYSDRLAEVTIPSTVQTIGSEAFMSCNMLTEVTILSTDAAIGENAFPNRSSLTIHGLAGSTAQAYAEGKDIVFESLSAASGSCGDNVTWTLSGSALVISGEGAMSDYSSASLPPYDQYKASIQQILIQPGVTHIGTYAFNNFTGVTNVTLPASLESIGNYAFRNCAALSGVTLPQGLTGIGSTAFASAGLTSVTIPGSVTTIGTLAFGDCASLTEIRFLGDAPEIGSFAFRNVTATAYYFNGTAGWTDAMKPYSGTLTWVGENPHGACGDDVTWSLDPATGAVTISGSGPMWDYEYNASPFFNNTSIQSVVIEQGVTRISTYSFSRCVNLTSVSIPDSVTEIGVCAFYDTGLTAVTLPDNLTLLERYAFTYSKLTEVSIPGSVETIGHHAFSSCNQLQTVTICEGVRQIDWSAFSICNNLTEITIPQSVTETGGEAFKNCGQLADVTFFNAGTAIGTNAFMDCPSGLTLHGFADSTAQAYALANGLNFLPFASGACGDNATWTLVDGTLLISGTGDMANIAFNEEAPWYADRASITAIVVGEGVTSIGSYSFKGLTNLTSVSIPGTVTHIRASAFYGCTSLESIVIPQGVQYVGESAFWGCSKLKTVTLPEGLTTIDGHAFRACSALTDINLPAGLTKIGGSAFFFCSNLGGDIVIPQGVTAIYADTFWRCGKITGVTIHQGVTQIGDRAFQYCTSLTDVTIYSLDAAFGSDVFDSCSADLTVTGWPGSTAESYVGEGYGYLPHSGKYGESACWRITDGTLTIYGTGATYDEYSGTYNLPWYRERQGVTTAVVEEGVTHIGARLFGSLPALTDVRIADSVTSIGDAAFQNSGALTTVTLGSGITRVASSLFRDCMGLKTILVDSRNPMLRSVDGILFSMDMTQLLAYPAGKTETSYTVPDGVLTIGPGAFASCANLTEILLPEGLTTIKNNAFQNCTGLRRIAIPDSVTSIGTAAFNGCAALTDISTGNGLTAVSPYLFNECTALEHITFGSGVTEIGVRVCEGCSALSEIRFTGDAPVFHDWSFMNLTLTAYYPGGNATWTADVMQDYAGAITWVASYPEPTFFLPAGLTTIESEAFSGISAVAVMIPDTVTSISGNPFAGSDVRFIYGTPGSPAQAFANTYGYTFVPVAE